MNERGISILGAVFTLLILMIFGAALVAIVSTDHENRRKQIEKEQTFYEIQAGFEYALKEIKDGGYPVKTNMPLGTGSFTISIDYPNHIIYATGTVGDMGHTSQITFTQMGGDCLSVNNDQVTLTGPDKTDMKGLTLKKVCNNAITIDKLLFTWSPNSGEKVKKIKIENNTVYNNPVGTPSGQIIDIPDYTLSGSVAHQINLIEFSSNMLNKDFTMTVYLSDTTYKVLHFVILPPNK
jgi:hypothetical protein